MAETDTEELGRQLVDAHEQLIERDQEFRYWRDHLRSRDEKIEALERQNADLEAQVADLEGEVHAMQETRLWRLGLRYRDTRDSVKRMLRLGTGPSSPT